MGKQVTGVQGQRTGEERLTPVLAGGVWQGRVPGEECILAEEACTASLPLSPVASWA